MLESDLAHVAHGGSDTGGHHVVVGLVLLQHQPHGFDVVPGKAPVALGVDVAQAQFLLLAELDAGHRVGNLARDELDAAQRRFVVEQDAAGGVQAEALAIVDGDPVAIELGHAVGAARVERRVLVLALGLDQAEHLAGGSLVEARFRAELADRLEQVGHAQAVDDAGGHRLVPGSPDEALCRQVVDLLRLRLDHRALHRTGIGHVAVLVLDIAFDPQFAQAPARVAAAPRHQAVDPVALLQQQLGQVRSVLTGDPSYQCTSCHSSRTRDSQSDRIARRDCFMVISGFQPVVSCSRAWLPRTRRCSARRILAGS